jgi:ribosomal protein S24E
MNGKNGNGNEVNEKILHVLDKHPEGLTIFEIARYVGMHRHTVTKYIYQLIGEGKIFERDVGAAKLCYLRERYIEAIRSGRFASMEKR